MDTTRLRQAHPMAGVAVVAEPDPDARALIASALASVSFQVTTASTFLTARNEISDRRPILFVAEHRLGVFNGLHLARRARLEQPRAVLILTSRAFDPISARDAEDLGATQMVPPITPDDLLLAVIRTATRRPNADGTWTPVRAPFERRAFDRRGPLAAGVMSAERRARQRRMAMPLDLLLPSIFQRIRDR